MSAADDLLERVRIERPLDTADTFGGAEERTWELVGEYFAQVTARGSRQASAANQVQTQVVYTVTLRAPMSIESDMRVLWRARVLAVDSIVPSAAHVELICHEERV